jgi:hypothetical protein
MVPMSPTLCQLKGGRLLIEVNTKHAARLKVHLRGHGILIAIVDGRNPTTMFEVFSVGHENIKTALESFK